MATVADPPGKCGLEQLRQAWELPSCQLCPQGRVQHSSRLPAVALAEPARGWHCRVAKQWPPGLASARAVVGGGREWGDPGRQPGRSFPPRKHRSGLMAGAYPGSSGCPPSLGSKPSLSGSSQRAGFRGAWVHRTGGKERMLVFGPAPSLSLRMAWDIPSGHLFSE